MMNNNLSLLDHTADVEEVGVVGFEAIAHASKDTAVSVEGIDGVDTQAIHNDRTSDDGLTIDNEVMTVDPIAIASAPKPVPSTSKVPPSMLNPKLPSLARQCRRPR